MLGLAGFVDTLLSYKVFIPLGRLSYTTYLVAVQVQCWYFGSYRAPSAFGNTIMVRSDRGGGPVRVAAGR